jgi:hypothetical protein
MAGLDAQRGGRPPPFLPVLVSLGRKLRRATAMIPNGPPASSRTGHGHTRAPSDVFTDDGEDDDVTRVRRLAHAFDAISSCSESEAEGDTLSFLREQITGDSISGYGRATPRKEREEVKWVPRRESVISVTSDVSAVSSLSAAASAEAESGAESEAESALSGISGGSQPLWRMGEADASGSAAAAASDAVALWAQTCTIPIAEESEPEESEVPVNAKEKEKEKDKEASDSAGERGSPPPPYQHGVETQARTPATLLFPPETDSLSSSTRSAPRSVPRSAPRSVSLTPLPRKSDNNDTNENDDHLIRMAAHSASGVDPYRVLRRGSGRPTVIAAMVDEDSPLWPRVSRRKASASASKGTPQREVSREVAELTKRIRELEARLVAVEKSPEGSPDGSPEGSPEPEAKAEAEAEAEAEEKEEEHVCPNCSHGFALSASTSTRLSASTSSGLTASTSSQPPTASGSLGASTISISTRSLSPADTATTDATDVTDATDASDATAVAAPLTPETGALVPASQYAAQNLSWLTRLGLVDEYGADHRYRDVPVYLFLMGVGVGVGFSAVVVKVMLAKRIV